jgi:FkbM family methyltransferase
MQSSKWSPFTIYYENSQEYHHLKGEIFTQDTYYFETDNPEPVIIDAGAYIGMATMYFKKNYPGAKVIAIEPNPTAFKILEKNIWENDLRNVETHQIALASEAGTRDFFFDETDDQWYSTGSFTEGAWTKTQTSQKISVPTRPLSDFLDEPVEFLKIDIEGAEQEVLFAAGEKILQVKQMMVEFHPINGQSIEEILEFLKQHGFKTSLSKKGRDIVLMQAHGLVYISAVQK